MVEYGEQIEQILNKTSVACRDYIYQELKSSLTSIGFSEELVSSLLDHLGELEVISFQTRFRDELYAVYSKGFLQNIVPSYFQKYVVPEIPEIRTLVDVGCGTGILAHIIEQSDKVKKVIGIDIAQYPEWKVFSTKRSEFRVIPEDGIASLLEKESPEAISMTWSLHHMEFDEQLRYLKMIFAKLPSGSKTILLEDSYAETIPPENGAEKAKTFFKWEPADRKTIMSVYDWVANRVLAQRMNEPIPFTYRTLEEWVDICQQVGFKVVRQRFIGFPEARDINTPQSLLVLKKE